MEKEYNFNTLDMYKKYPELIPFVGDNYEKAKIKILLVGESHYTHKNKESCLDGMAEPGSNDSLKDINDWYAGKLLQRLPETNTLLSNKDSYNTVGVVRKYLNDKKLDRSYHIFDYPAKVISEYNYVSNENLNERDAFKYISFINYFQRPEFSYGNSIKLYEIDEKIAFENFCNVINKIKPELIIFVSRLAYNSFNYYSQINNYSCNIKCTRIPHPCSAWWNRRTKNGLDGRKRLMNILESL